MGDAPEPKGIDPAGPPEVTPEPRHAATRVTIYAPTGSEAELVREYVARGYRVVDGPREARDNPDRGVVVLERG